MTTSQNWLSQFLRWLAAGVEGKKPEHLQIPAREVAQVTDQDLDNSPASTSAAQPEKNELKLTLASSGFIVTCVSCSSPHELDAVCYRCGSPLCKDERNCRLWHTLDDIGGRVFVCPACHQL